MNAARRRVFILGAGVSASAGISVAKDILRSAIVQLGESSDSAKAEQVHDLLEYLYPSFNQELRNYPNIEDFLNQIEMARNFNDEKFLASNRWSPTRLKAIESTTVKAVTEYIWECMRKKERQRPIDDFVRLALRPRDTIITFNWDLTIERSLESYAGNPGFEYTYSRTRKTDAFSLLKPHGSIDWFEKSVITRPGKSDILSLDKELCVFPYFSRAKNPELLSPLPVIVPPVTSKKFEFEFLRRTWRAVFRAVSDATELHVIGYSLPKEDQFARFVLRRALRNNLVNTKRGTKRRLNLRVVNPDDGVGSIFAKLVPQDFGNSVYFQSTVQDYVNWLELQE